MSLDLGDLVDVFGALMFASVVWLGLRFARRERLALEAWIQSRTRSARNELLDAKMKLTHNVAADVSAHIERAIADLTEAEEARLVGRKPWPLRHQ